MVSQMVASRRSLRTAELTKAMQGCIAWAARSLSIINTCHYCSNPAHVRHAFTSGFSVRLGILESDHVSPNRHTLFSTADRKRSSVDPGRQVTSVTEG